VINGRFGALRAPVLETTTGGERSPSADYLEIAAGLGYSPLPSRNAELSDTYWDTPAFDFLRAGFTLRLRRAVAGVEVTLKSLDRLGFEDLETRRLEVGGPVGDASRPLDPTGWPEAVREHVRAVAGEAPEWMPLCVLHQRRERIPLVNGEGGNGSVVAALNIDVVGIFDPHGIAADHSLQGVARLLHDGAPIANVTELELEPVADDAPAVVRELAKRFRAIPDCAPAAGSQLEQALEILADHQPGATPGELGIVPEMAMAEAGRVMWRRQLLAMLLNEAGARRGEDPEYVHDMRVAIRRARAAARLFGSFFRRKALREHLDNLRRTARVLGAVRDADVALLELRQAHRLLSEWLDSAEYRNFVVRFAAFCQTPGLGVFMVDSGSQDTPARGQVRHVIPSAILKRFEQVRAYEPLLESAQPPSVAALHALRIDCKALRYSLEPVEHLLGEEAGDIIRQLKRLQDVLGDLNDAVVVVDRLAALDDVVEPTALASHRARQQSILADLVAAAPEEWRAFVAPDNRRLLAVAIARL
jgi:CHAD domain-containing protein